MDALFSTVVALAFVYVLTRHGLLALTTQSFVINLVNEVPLTVDASLWWAPRSWAVLAVLTALAIYGFRTALAGKPVLGGDWVET